MKKPLCTVLIPFNEAGIERFDRLQRLAEELGFRTLRVAQYYSSGMIHEEIVSSIRDADLVIADLSGANPNVCYELGIAHALGKRVFITSDDPAAIIAKFSNLHACRLDATIDGLDGIAGELRSFVRIPGCLSPIQLFTGGSSVHGHKLLWKRIGAFLIDLAILMIPLAVLFIAIPPSSKLAEWLPGTLMLVCFICYYFFTSMFLGASPGQRLLSLKVIRLDRSQPSAWQSLFRPIASLLSLSTLGITFFWAGKAPRHQAVHDNLTRTLVVKASGLPQGYFTPH